MTMRFHYELEHQSVYVRRWSTTKLCGLHCNRGWDFTWSHKSKFKRWHGLSNENTSCVGIVEKYAWFLTMPWNISISSHSSACFLTSKACNLQHNSARLTNVASSAGSEAHPPAHTILLKLSVSGIRDVYTREGRGTGANVSWLSTYKLLLNEWYAVWVVWRGGEAGNAIIGWTAIAFSTDWSDFYKNWPMEMKNASLGWHRSWQAVGLVYYRPYL